VVECLPIFPTAIGRSILNRNFTNSEIHVFKQLSNDVRENEGNFTSINSNVLNLNELKDIKDFILTETNQYLTEIFSPANNLNLYITSSWVNYSRYGNYHHRHNHPNSIISGVLYINANSDIDSIRFFKTNNSSIDISTNNYNQYNSKSWNVHVNSNDLILFPSMLDHQVDIVRNNETRISLAFNTFVKGQIGDTNLNTFLEI
jgi:uncharacterized protein (TIGR02466 family)